MTKVLFIAYYFPPLGGAPVQRTLKFVKLLPAEGYLPTIVCGPELDQREYVSGLDPTLMESVPAEVCVHRAKGPVPKGEGKIERRLIRWLALEHPFSKWWISSATEVASRVVAETELIFATMDPFESAEVATKLSERFGIPWVADLRDPWALDEMQRYATWLHRRVARAKMGAVLSSASLIIMNTPEAVYALKRSFPHLRNKKVIYITNGFDRDDFAGLSDVRTDGKFRVIHSGGMWTGPAMHLRRRWINRALGGIVRGFDLFTRSHVILLQAVERWCGVRPEVRKDLELVFVGKTSSEDRAVAAASEVPDLVRFLNYLPHTESTRLLRSADLLFFPMHNLPKGTRATVVPGKAYEYMASGKPILAAVPDGDAHDFMTRCGTGLVCRPDDIDGMTRILDSVYEAWKRGETVGSVNEHFISQFERRNLTRALARAFDGVLDKQEAEPCVELSPATGLAKSS